ncbi:ABC transporter substrate-binding protein [Methylibium sp.]|uniref:ABC transporter substrate-binding protein n=1 Tax=Methylibium sp. TaxID=2067992 RepID=UPI003BAD6E66
MSSIPRTLAVLVVTAACTVFPTHATDNAAATWKSISDKAQPAAGSAIEINTNYWLAWTGAWDTVIMKEAKLWEKWLPKGSKVNWKRNLQGPPVITDLVANKQQIGYIGDNPAIVATTKQSLAPISIVAVNEMSPGRMCGLIMVRSDAPKFKDYREAVKWLDGKTVGAPKGSCADRLGQHIFKKEGVNVVWQQMQGEVIITSLQAKRIDAAVLYEPHVSKAVFDGHARYAVSPAAYGEQDANAVLMRKDFITAHRPAAVAWLKANIEALYFLRDRPVDTVNFIKRELPDYTRENIWFAIYGRPPEGIGASQTALKAEMVLTQDARALLQRGHDFLRELKVHQEASMHPDALNGELVAQAFKELGLDPTKGLYEIPVSDRNPFKGDDLVTPAQAK